MKVKRPTGTEPTFGWKLNKKEAQLIKSLPKEQLDIFEKRMLNAPIDDTKEASSIRDNILCEAIELAKKLKKLGGLRDTNYQCYY